MTRRATDTSQSVQRGILSVRDCSAIVAIPARNEENRISRCLAALAVQRDRLGSPLAIAEFGVLLLVNNTTDATARAAREVAHALPYPLEVLEIQLLQNASAGGARRRVMHEAAERLGEHAGEGILLTTDADSVVTPSWFFDNLLHLKTGADCVAGYIDGEPTEIISHGASFLARGRVEDFYIRLTAEIYARCDPRPHDPWPNHRVSSGASLAVKLAAYTAVGGMPGQALGEDVAFTALLDESGFKVRHALDVSVLTSCRLDGRATGGAADTMRYRRDTPDAPCDAELEPAFATLRRAAYRGFLRNAFKENAVPDAARRLLKVSNFRPTASDRFFHFWKEIEDRHPKLKRGAPLRPSELPRQIAAAKFILRHLRRGGISAPDDRRPRAKSPALADA